MFLLDTNVISELRPGKAKASVAVLRWAASVPMSQQYLSVITVLELEEGVQRLQAMRPAQGDQLRAWVTHVRRQFAGRVLAFGEPTAVLCGALLAASDPLPERDTMIAATALEHGFTVVTRNVGGFDRSGAKLFNPWEAL